MKISDDYASLCNYFNSKIIEQKEVVNGILMNLKLRDELLNKRKNVIIPLNILLSGASGTGKTHAVKLICDELDIPFIARNITDYTSSGYVGNELSSIFKPLVAAAEKIASKRTKEVNDGKKSQVQLVGKKNNLGIEVQNILEQLTGNKTGNKSTTNGIKLAQVEGVIFLDEIDKILFKSSSYNVGTDGVLREILTYLSGSQIDVEKSDFGTFDTSKIIFICAGAFDLVNYKDIPTELLGRLGTRLRMSSPTAESISSMLLSPETGTLNNLNLIIRHVKGMKGIKVKPETAMYVGKVFCESEKTNPIGLRRLTALVTELMKYYYELEIEGNPRVIELTKDVFDICFSIVNKGLNYE